VKPKFSGTALLLTSIGAQLLLPVQIWRHTLPIVIRKPGSKQALSTEQGQVSTRFAIRSSDETSNTPYSDLCHRPTAVVRVNFPDLPVGTYSQYHLTYVLHSYKGHGAQTKIHLCFFHPPSDNYRRSHPKSFLTHLDFTNSDISITAMNVNKKFDRFKQWAGEKMGGDAKTNTSDDFKMLELEMNLRHEGREKSPSQSFY
jgi:hypothetical protein